MKCLLLVYGLTANKFLFFLVFLLGFAAQPVWAMGVDATLFIFSMASNNDANVGLEVIWTDNGVTFSDPNPIDGNIYHMSSRNDSLRAITAGDTFSGPLGLPADAGHSEVGFELRFDAVIDPASPTSGIPEVITDVQFNGSVFGQDSLFFGLGSITEPGNVITSQSCNADTFSSIRTCNEQVNITSPFFTHVNIDPSQTKVSINRAGLTINTTSTSSESNYTGSIEFTIQAVPLPTTVWLFGSGLIGLIGVARRKKA